MAKLDAKGRLRIPAKFREVLQKHYTDALIIFKRGECLVAYPPEKWKEVVESKAENLSQFFPAHLTFVRHFVSVAEQCGFDSQGRILIPPMLREDTLLNQEVILVGMLWNFEIWKKDAYDLQVARDSKNQAKAMEAVATSGL